jgi:RNAse (barnase) inhibitor barstar
MYREVTRAIGAAYTVRELIRELENADLDAPVFFVCDYGDHAHTQQALPVEIVFSDVSTDNLTESAYSHSGVRLIEESDEDAEEAYPVVILR